MIVLQTAKYLTLLVIVVSISQVMTECYQIVCWVMRLVFVVTQKPMQKLKFVNKANLSIKQRLHQVTLRLMTFTLLVLVVKLKFLLLKQMVKYKNFRFHMLPVVQMLRPGVNRYSLTVGQFRDQDIDLNPWVVQGKYQQGINNYLTGYTGIQATENYAAVLLGAAFATPIGAVALDVTHSEADF